MIDQSDILEHYGVRGMRWGVRKAPGTSAAPSATRGKSGKPKTAPKGQGFGNAKAAVVNTAKAMPYKKIGKNVALAVVATAGAIGAASLGGPMAGAAAGALIRGVTGAIGTTTTSYDSSHNTGQRPTTQDGKTWSGDASKLDATGRDQVNRLLDRGDTFRETSGRIPKYPGDN